MRSTLLALAAAAALSAGAVHAESATYAVDPTHTFATFEISHFGASVNRGRFDRKEGVVQFDKAAPQDLRAWCPPLRERHPRLHLLAAGGINAGNAADYAASGVDALVTSSLHYAPPADVGVSVEPL